MPDTSPEPLSRRLRILVVAPFILTAAIFVGAETGAMQQAIAYFSGEKLPVTDFLEVLRNDASHNVRERAGCSLAKSGMLTREQRMQAVPGLIDLASDSSLDETTNHWVYQALREITDVSIPNDPMQWRDWYTHHGSEQIAKFHRDGDAVLGNN